MNNNHKWARFALLSIIITAIIMRLIKLYEYTIWGSDTGEHYFLLNQLITSGEVQVQYNGWGFAYPYFPGMNLINTAFTNTSNISPFGALVIITPIIAALSVIIIYCIAQRIFHDVRVSIISAAIVAVVMPHVYTSSHPVPGSVGGFLLLTCIFLLLKSYDNRKFAALLIITSFALVITHHLTVYFLIISIIGIVIFREFLQKQKEYGKEWINRTKLDLMYLIFLLTISMSFWFVYAEQFYERIIAKYLPITPLGIILLSYFAVFIFWQIIKYVRKLKLWTKPKKYTKRGFLIKIALYWIFGLIVLLTALQTKVPGTNMQTDPSALPIFIPLMIPISFIIFAPSFLKYFKDGIIPLGWMAAILISLVFAFLTQSQELLMYRHLPYIIEPISILVGFGLVKSYEIIMSKDELIKLYREQNNHKKDNLDSNLTYKKNYKRIYSIKKSAGLIQPLCASSLIVITLVFCALFAYPPLSVVAGFEEGTTNEEFESCIWSRENLPNASTVGSDHRMSSMVFGFSSLNASWEYIPKTFHSDSYEDIRGELNNTLLPSGRKRIDYILITSKIEDGVALEQWETAEPMSEDAKMKFDKEPFIKIYDNGEARIYYYVDTEKYLDGFKSNRLGHA